LMATVLNAQSSSSSSSSSPFHLRINGGGPLIVVNHHNNKDQNTRWESDTPYNVGNKGNRRNICTNQPNISITNVPSHVPSSVYCTQRFYAANNIFTIPPFQYNIPVPNNNAYYIVKLHFVEMVRFALLI
jgi:hypothetical protein